MCCGNAFGCICPSVTLLTSGSLYQGVHLWHAGMSVAYLSQLCMARSSGHCQGHGSEKVCLCMLVVGGLQTEFHWPPSVPVYAVSGWSTDGSFTVHQVCLSAVCGWSTDGVSLTTKCARVCCSWVVYRWEFHCSPSVSVSAVCGWSTDGSFTVHQVCLCLLFVGGLHTEFHWPPSVTVYAVSGRSTDRVSLSTKCACVCC